MKRSMNYIILICLTVQTLTKVSLQSTQTSFVSHEKPLNQNTELTDIKTSVVCNTTSLVVNFTFRDSFFGVIYANQIFSSSASQCRSYGNGSKVVHFVTNSHECGVRSIDNQSSYNEYELVLYVQNDRNIQQASDEKIEVKCAPQELLLTGNGVVGNQRNQLSSKFNGKSLYGGSYIEVHQMRSHNFTLSHITDSLECRMDVMKGRIPFLKPIDGFVDLGQDVTVMIKVKEIDDIDSMVSRCYAHEGTHAVKQELTNSDGCSIDTNILPNFKLLSNPPSDFKVYYTTFPAFKFPDKTNLNIQCTVIICNKTCPQIQCDNSRGSSPAPHRIKRLSNSPNANRAIIMEKKFTPSSSSSTPNNNNEKRAYDSLLSKIGASNWLSIKNGHSIDNEDHKNISSIDRVYINEFRSKCLTSQVMLTFGLLMTFAFACVLTITCFCGIKFQELNQKLLNIICIDWSKTTYSSKREKNQSFLYSTMADLTI